MTETPDFSLIMDSVAVSRGSLTLFDNLSFALRPMDVMWLQGTNGSGKTTLLNLATGFLKPHVGSIRWIMDGDPVLPSELICYQGHTNALKPDLRVIEDLTFWHDIYDVDTDPVEILSLVNLSDKADLYCRQLSAGQKRRLVLGRLLLSRKPVWIMDEPTASIDADGQSLIYSIVRAHAENGGAVILATHRAPVRINRHTRVMSLESA